MLIDPKIHKWYAVYTKSRNEKKVMQLLLDRGIEAYVPIQKTLKVWSDRKKWVEEPLLRSYAFVKIIQKDYIEVLQTPGVVRYVFYLKKPASIPDNQIQLLKDLIEQNIDIEISNETFAPGDKVEVILGPLTGMIGDLVETKGSKKVLIKIDHISNNLLINIGKDHLKKIIQKVHE